VCGGTGIPPYHLDYILISGPEEFGEACQVSQTHAQHCNQEVEH